MKCSRAASFMALVGKDMMYVCGRLMIVGGGMKK